MSDIRDAPIRRRPRYRLLRNLLVVFVLLVLAAALAWYFLNQYLQIETYRPLLEAKIEDATDLPARVDRLELAFGLRPVIRAHDVRIGEDNFRLEAKEAIIWPELKPLLERRIRVTRIDLVDLAAVGPSSPAELRERFKALVARMSERKGGRIRFDVDRLQAREAAVYIEGTQTPVFQGDVDVTDALSPTPSARVSAVVRAMGDEVQADGTVHLRRGPNNRGIENIRGSFDVEGLHLAEVMPSEKTPRVTLEVEGVFSGDNPRNIAVRLNGAVEPLADARPLAESLEGPFRAEALWDGHQLRIRDVEWQAAGVRVDEAELVRTEDGGFRADVPHALLGRVTLAPLLARIPSKKWRVVAASGASVEVADVRAIKPPEAPLRVEGGTLQFTGLSVFRGDDVEVAKDLRGSAAWTGDAVRIDEIAGDGLRVTGTVTPDFEARSATVDLEGTLRLSKDRLALFVPVDALRRADGAVTVDRLTATFAAGTEGLPEDFRVEGRVEDGRLALTTKRVADTFAPVTGRFTAGRDAVEFEVRGTASEMGPVTTQGVYRIAERTYTGTAAADLTRVVTPHLSQERAREVVPPLLAAYGESTFEIAIELPSADNRQGAIRLVRQGEPRLEGTVQLVRRKERTEFGDIEATALLPLASAAEVLPESVAAEGTAALAFARDVRQKAFAGRIDLTSADVRVGEYARKRPGLEARIEVTGTAGDAWQARMLEAFVGSESARGVWQEGRLVFPALDLDAAALAPLLGEGDTARGRISGALRFGPARADLVAHDVGFTRASGAAVESVTGGIGYGEGILSLNDLAVSAANSRAVLNLVRANDTWEGRVVAEQLDLAAVLDLRKALVTPTDAAPPRPAAADAAKPPFRGRIDIETERFLLRRADIPQMHAVVRNDGASIVLDSLSARPAGGVATGTVVLEPPKADGPWVTRSRINLDKVGAQALDALLFAEPRGFGGIISGEIALTVPLVGESTINGTSGRAELVGEDGTFGRFGLATQILNVLRTTEIFRLRLPSLRDEGLTYDTASFNMNLEKGVMTVEEFALERPSFAMRGEGVVNFPADEMLLEFDVFPFQTVTGVVQRVPIIGRAVSELRKLAPLGLVARGSPYDPTVTPESLSIPGSGARAREAVGSAPAAEPTDAPEAEPADAPDAVPEEPEAGETPPPPAEAEASPPKTGEEERGRGLPGRGIARGLRGAAKDVIDSVRGKNGD